MSLWQVCVCSDGASVPNVGLITKDDETAYREEGRALRVWCQKNNHTLNVNKTKEMIVDFRKVPIHIDGTVVEKVDKF